LSEDEAKCLVELEERIETAIGRARDSFVEIGLTLREIRDSGRPSQRLYRQTHATFEEYCRDRWGFNDSRARQLVIAAQRYQSLAAVKNLTVLPSTESHVAALGRCESDEQAAEVWEAVVEDAPDPSKITAAFIKQYVDAVTGHKP